MEDSRLALIESNPKVIQAIILLAILLPIGLLPLFLSPIYQPQESKPQRDSSKFKYLDLGNQPQKPKTKPDSTKYKHNFFVDQPQKPAPEPGLSGYKLRDLERRLREFTEEKTSCININGYPRYTSYLVSQGNKDWRVFAEIYCKGRHGTRCGTLAYQKFSKIIYIIDPRLRIKGAKEPDEVVAAKYSIFHSCIPYFQSKLNIQEIKIKVVYI